MNVFQNGLKNNNEFKNKSNLNFSNIGIKLNSIYNNKKNNKANDRVNNRVQNNKRNNQINMSSIFNTQKVNNRVQNNKRNNQMNMSSMFNTQKVNDVVQNNRRNNQVNNRVQNNRRNNQVNNRVQNNINNQMNMSSIFNTQKVNNNVQNNRRNNQVNNRVQNNINNQMNMPPMFNTQQANNVVENNRINNQIIVNVQNNRNLNFVNKGKYHYFVGFKIPNDAANKMKGTQKYFLRNNKVIEPKKVKVLNGRLAYLGYLDNNASTKFINYINPLMRAIAAKFKPIEINMEKLDYFKRPNGSSIKVGLKYENDKLLKMKEYLKINAIDKVFGEETFCSNMYINLFTFNIKKNRNNKKRILENIKKFKLRDIKFNIDSLCILKGEPIKIRRGTPSAEDEMLLEEVERFDLVGTF